jgi:ABC-type Fe3+/spermidine/putrescine transport system ATPase subunit
MIEIKGVVKEYGGIRVVDNVSFCINEKEKISICGESGCGKTTLLNIIAGITAADEGSILKDGKPLPLKPHEREVSMVFQDSTLWNNMTVRENILFGSPYKDKKEREEQVLKLAETFGIEELLDRYPYKISGGQARRVAIARALACERELLLLDEPFSNLDKEWKERTVMKTKELCAENCAVILVTHSESEADCFCDTHLHMAEGRIK